MHQTHQFSVCNVQEFIEEKKMPQTQKREEDAGWLPARFAAPLNSFSVEAICSLPSRSGAEELGCSPTSRERELGLDRRRASWFHTVLQLK